MKEFLKVALHVALGACSTVATLLGAAGLYFVATEILPGVFRGPDMSGNAGWAVFGLLLFGVPSGVLLVAGIVGGGYLWRRRRK
jgi:hypothetical protein